MPEDTNMLGTAFGGQIMRWMDVAASVAATRHCGQPSVTASVDDLSFARPIRMGDIVILRACVNFTGRTSMEVGVRIEREDPLTHVREHALSGYLTFVAVDGQGQPTEVPALEPLTEVENAASTPAGRGPNGAGATARPAAGRNLEFVDSVGQLPSKPHKVAFAGKLDPTRKIAKLFRLGGPTHQ